jgi:hypothetical protein
VPVSGEKISMSKKKLAPVADDFRTPLAPESTEEAPVGRPVTTRLTDRGRRTQRRAGETKPREGKSLKERRWLRRGKRLPPDRVCPLCGDGPILETRRWVVVCWSVLLGNIVCCLRCFRDSAALQALRKKWKGR